MDGRRLGEAFAVLGSAASNPDEARRRVGQIALAADTGPEQAHIARMRAMAGADQWPDRQLLITALDAETGEQEVFDRASGAPLPSAVAASTAFPGIYPPITINGRRYMDGSLRTRIERRRSPGWCAEGGADETHELAATPASRTRCMIVYLAERMTSCPNRSRHRPY